MLLKAFHTLHYLSIDVALGALSTSLFAGRFLQSTASNSLFLGTFSAVLSIYNFDHYFDSKFEPDLHDPRRVFHFRHRKIILSIALLSAIIAAVCLYLVSRPILIALATSAGFCGTYFFLLWIGKIGKLREVAVAIGYTLGIWTPHFVSGKPRSSTGLLIALFLGACLLNLLGLSLLDRKEDIQRGEATLAVRSESFVLFFTRAIFVIGCIVAIACAKIEISFEMGVVFLHFWLQAILCYLAERRMKAVREIGEWSFLIFAIIPIAYGYS